MRLGLFEHGGFLNPLLFGFFPYLATGVEEAGVPDPILGPDMPAMTLYPPTEPVSDHPMTYAVIANHPVDAQVEHTLGTLARMLARQELVSQMDETRFARIDQLAAEADKRADLEVSDLIRTRGWQAAAASIKARAEGSGMTLAVSFADDLMGPEQIALRPPLLRRVYNEAPKLREAVDKIAVTLSQGLSVMGGGKEAIAAFGRDYLDLGMSRTFLAHLARDAFVCGNGYLSFGTVPDEDMRLLQPEHVTVDGPNAFTETSSEGETRHTQVMHIRGAEQQASPYGLSVLEPFLSIQAEHDTLTRTALLPDAWARAGVPDEIVAGARGAAEVAKRTLRASEQKIDQLLGASPSLRVEVPPNLYFRNQTQMRPAAGRIALRANREVGG